MKRDTGGIKRPLLSLHFVAVVFILAWTCVNIVLWCTYKPSLGEADWLPKRSSLTDKNVIWPENYPKDNVLCKEVDVVYTWVNGSDPNHIKLLQQCVFHCPLVLNAYSIRYVVGEAIGKERFRDYGILR